MLHLDADLYSSTRTVLQAMAPNADPEGRGRVEVGQAVRVDWPAAAGHFLAD